MRTKTSLLIQLLLLILVVNGLLLGVLYWQWQTAAQTNSQATYPFSTSFFITFAVAAWLLWLVLALWLYRRIDGAVADALSEQSQSSATSITATEQRPAPQPKPEPPAPKPVIPQPVIPQPAIPQPAIPQPAIPQPAIPQPAIPQPIAEAPARPQPPPDAAALQMLSILQREGRLIDFLQEDLSLYEDDQIGAAVRNIHAGCKQALNNHVQLAPVLNEIEGNPVMVPAGFDAYAIRLTGAVTGNPPFSGLLRHRGWRAVKVDLPQQTPGQDASRVIAAAEVEVGA